MLPASEVKTRLAARAADVARYLLPGGRVESGNWCAGSTAGGKGDSLRVQLTGSKVGLWSDFATGADKGDLLDLWAAAHNISLGQALREAKQWLGIGDPVSAVPSKKYVRPKPQGVFAVQESDPVKSYLTDQRLLTEETIAAFKIKARGQGDKAEIAYPSFEPAKLSIDGVQANPPALLAVKYIAIARTAEGKKVVTQEAGCAPCLFGWQAFDFGARALVLTEGQIDCMTWSQLGYPALSVPNGTGDTENWIDFEWDNLQCFDTIYISFDMDEPGREACYKVAKRLGIHRCMVVDLPHKDANECLKQGCEFHVFKSALDNAKPYTPNEIKKATEFRSQIHALIKGDHGELEHGLKTKVFGPRIRFRLGEATVWTGHTTHGKSTLLNQIMIEALMAGERVAVGSFEVKGPITIKKMAHCIALKGEDMTIEDADHIIDWMGDKLWIFDVFGIVKRDRLMELMLYAVQRCGVSHFVIDSLMKCDLSSEDYEAQRVFLNTLIEFAQRYMVHLHIVAHPRKSGDDDSPPGVYDIHGGQAVTAQPDNVISVWRNKAKEKKRESKTMADHVANVEPDTIVFVNKQRLTGVEFRTKLWFWSSRNRFVQHWGEGEPSYEDFGILPKGEVQPVEE